MKNKKQPCSSSSVIIHTNAQRQQNTRLVPAVKDVEDNSNVRCKRDAMDLDPEYAMDWILVRRSKQQRWRGDEPGHQKIQHNSKTHRNIYHKFRHSSSLWSPARLPFKIPFSTLSVVFSVSQIAVKDPVLGCLMFQYAIGLNGSRNALQEEWLVIVQVPTVNLNQAQLT